MIEFIKLEDVKTVSKPWGWEKWIQPGDAPHSYVLKEIQLNKGFRTSIQVHQFKSETNYILEGTGEIWYSEEFFDCEKYAAGGYTADDISIMIANLKCVTYIPGNVMKIVPGTIHRMVATTDLRFVEASTTHLDDVIRLQDDANRTHGKIEAEHS
jgi:mannose-6-phosphate isomerase